MNKLSILKFTTKKQVILYLLIMWVICFFISLFFAAFRYDTSVLSILTYHTVDLIPVVIILPISFVELIGDIIPSFKYGVHEIIIYFIFTLALIFIHITTILKRSIVLYTILVILMLILSYSWVYITLGLSWV